MTSPDEQNETQPPASDEPQSNTPTYPLLDEKGPDHSKCFQVAAQVGSKRYAPAWGRNKKEAEQRAARNALSELSRETSRAAACST